MELSICERFPSVSPIALRRERASEVFLLMRRMIDHNARESKAKSRKKNVIRRPAGDDWF